ncbi:putative ferric-chelate reductase 1 homolog [Chironomus tepperi]|uniref:putative ferric-chelate reductase 1 homolog n=1 Tax=Chironomus tepperi TaxID=113505 RepID=UPI00391F7B3E
MTRTENESGNDEKKRESGREEIINMMIAQFSVLFCLSTGKHGLFIEATKEPSTPIMLLPYWMLAIFNSTMIRSMSYSVGLSLSSNEVEANPMYQGCGDTKLCIGYPSGCVKRKSCKAFAASYHKDGKYLFEMHSAPNAAYIASALSFDRRMGDDSAMECVKVGNEVKIYASYTIRESGTYDAIRSGIPQDIIRLQEGKIDENGISCVIERDESSVVDSKTFDLKTGKFYLLLATGSKVKTNKIQAHNLGHAISDKTLNSYV